MHPALRVCIASQSFYPVYAGPAVRFSRYLPGLLARGISVRVYTGTPNPVKAAMSGMDASWGALPSGEMLPTETFNGVPLHRVRLPDRSGLRREACFSRRLVDLCRQPEFRPAVIQLLSMSVAAIPGLLRLRRLGISTVFTRTMLPDMPDHPAKRALLRRYIALPSQLVSCVVVSSSVMRASLDEFGISTRVEVIPNGVDTQRFRPPAEPRREQGLRNKLGIEAEDTVLLFVGPVSPRKGADLLLRMWCRLGADFPRLHLVVAGPRRDVSDPAHEAFHREIESLLAGSGAAERVHFVGLVENVEEYMRAADIFVFTSRREGMPNVIPEAMASGLATVSTPFIGLPREFGEPDREYLLADFDADSIAAQVRRLVENRELRFQLGGAARSWAERQMAVDHSLDRYAELYRDLASCNRHNGALA